MKIGILGFGREGESAYRHWKDQASEIVVHDNNTELNLPDGVGSVLGANALADLDSYGYDLIVRSPGLRLDSTGLKTPITTGTNEFLKKCPAKVIGVTGTKGKGTTSTLIYEILCLAGYKAHLLGNIGSPALDELPNIKKDHVVVYEMSSFQLYDIKKSPDVAVCLMVTEDHLDWHKDLNEYHHSKGNIFNFQQSDDTAVYFKDDQISTSLAELSKAENKLTYGLNADVSFGGDSIIAFGQKVIEQDEIALPGPHNLQNVAAAICAVWQFCSDVEIISKIIRTFRGLPYHIEEIGTKEGVRIFNDSFSSNPTASSAAINSFDDPIVLYLGGVDRGVSFEPVVESLKKKKIRKIITYGQAGQKIRSFLKKSGITKVECIDTNDFKSIVLAGIDEAKSGDVIIFSPGCASQDMFIDYKDRGNIFNLIISELVR